jgi:hypothetical protein
MNSAVMRNCIRTTWISVLVFVMLSLGGCSGNVGVGVSVGVPIGNHGHMSVGSSRWF